MGLLEKYQSSGTILNSEANKTPTIYNYNGVLNDDTLVGSTLDLDGKTPTKYSGISALENVLPGYSLLDLDGKTPKTYI